MKFRGKLYKMIQNNIFIVLLFALLSILSAFILERAHYVYYGSDIIFHWARIYDIRESILHGSLFNDIALNNFNQNGSAVMTMYPKLNIFPIVFLTFFIKSFVKIMYITFILRNFLSLLISYFSCLRFTHKKLVSYIFSISYTLSTVTLFYCFKSMDMGVSSSLIYLPLVLFGTYELLRNNHWKELAIGISAVAFCHVITASMSMMLVFIILCINYKKIVNIDGFFSLFKMVITILFITGIFWVPFLVISIKNNISMPAEIIPLEGINYNDFMGGIFNNSISQFINIFAFLGIIISIVNYKKMLMYSKQIFWISIIFLILSTNFIPWNLLRKTFLEYTFQFPYRFLVIGQLLFIYLFSEQIAHFVSDKNHKAVIAIILSSLVLCTQVTAQKDIAMMANSPQSIDASNRIYDYVNNGVAYYTDYFPKKSIVFKDDITNHLGTYNDNEKTVVKLSGNGKFKFKLDNVANKVNMPFVMYNGINYQVKVDNKNAKFHSDNHSQLTLGHMNKGKHTVQVIVHKSWYDYLSYVLSAVGVVALVFAWIRLLILKRNK